MTVDLDWKNLGFNYRKLPFRYISYYKDGKWDEGQLTEDATLHISEASPALHYGQEAFEGLPPIRTTTHFMRSACSREWLLSLALSKN